MPGASGLSALKMEIDKIYFPTTALNVTDNLPELEIDDDDAAVSFMDFAENILKLNIYEWQEDSIEPFDEASEKLVRVTLRTPNGSGKSAVVIPALALGWLYYYPKGRVVLTTKDGRQLDGQVMPALEAHRNKFPEWKFVERRISTPTGGTFNAFTTDDAGRAEGWHKLDDYEGPLLIIVDEAKSVPEEIFTALDRCTYNALLLASSPGLMVGRFYESHAHARLGFIRIKSGLRDCPHIGKDKIDRIMAQHGPDAVRPNPEFIKSTLDGEFMLYEGETKFDGEGLDHILAMAKEGHAKADLGVLESSRSSGSTIFLRNDETPWLWMDEPPEFGESYLIACDPNSCEQGSGTSERDNTACAVLRKGRITSEGEKKDAVVAVLHWPGGVKWDSDILAERIAMLSKFYGDTEVVVEANNFGSALMKELQIRGVKLWQRTKIDDVNPNKRVKLHGFLSTGRSREHWVQACSKAIRDQSLICRYQPAANEFSSFITLPSGRSEAQTGCHDDWVSCIGIGLTVQNWTKMSGAQRTQQQNGYSYNSMQSYSNSSISGSSPWGACG